MQSIDTQYIVSYFFRAAYQTIRAWPNKILTSMRRLGDFTREYFAYRKLRRGESTPLFFYGQLHDNTSTTGFDHHYLFQSLWAFQDIVQHRPASHVDIGSLLDFVAHVSTISPTTFVDIRLPEITWANLALKEGSILKLPFEDNSIGSLSCLHVVEHIGLGRYGDPLNPRGTIEAIKELQRILAPGGILYFSTPTGWPRTYFNAHRVSSPFDIISWFDQLHLVELAAVTDDLAFRRNITAEDIARARYACGMYKFTKG